MVEQIGQRDPTRGRFNLGAAHAVEEAARIAAADLHAVEAVDLGQPDAVLHCGHFGGDDIVGFVEPKAVGDVEIRRGLEVLHPLPAIDDRELCALGFQHGGQRRGPGVAPGWAVLIGEMEAEFVLIVLNGLQGAELDVAVFSETTRVQHPSVVAGFSVHNLLGQQPAVATAFAQSGAKADDAEGIALARDGADQRRTVDGVGDRAVDHGVNPDFFERRHSGEGPFEHVDHAVEVVRAEGVREVRVDPVHAPGPTVLLIETNQQAVLLLPAVVVADRASEQRHTVAGFFNRRDGIGEHVLMLHRHHRVVHAHHRADFVHTVAAGVDHHVAIDVALGGFDGPGVVRVLLQPRHSGVAVDLGTGFARPAGQRLTQLGGVDVPVERIPKAAHQILGRNQRVTARALFGVDDLKVHVHTARHAGKVMVAFHLRLRVGEPDTAVGVVVVDGIVWVIGEFLVEVDRMGLQPHHRLVHAEVRDLRSGVPCRPAGQFIPLHQNDVGPSLLRQVVQRRAACDAAPDDDGLGPRFHSLVSGGFLGLSDFGGPDRIGQRAAFKSGIIKISL